MEAYLSIFLLLLPDFIFVHRRAFVVVIHLLPIFLVFSIFSFDTVLLLPLNLMILVGLNYGHSNTPV